MKRETEIEMGPFVEVSPEAWVGEGCRLGSHCHVQGGAVLGMRVEVEGGVILHGGVTIEDEVRIGEIVVELFSLTWKKGTTFFGVIANSNYKIEVKVDVFVHIV
jgi:UDP-3-O-[3-hydroxymyristoyl] glucosamine N-acyltransferase